jgi:hypothetical protein
MNSTEDRMGLPRLLLAAIFLLGLGLRTSNLDTFPLSDSEASEALWAAEGTPEDSVFWPREQDDAGTSAVYQTVTWIWFQAVGGGDAAARLFPAVIGALIVLPPWLLRRRLGRLGALTGSFLLAISPTLVASARAADGTSAAMVAVALGAAALILGLDEEWRPARVTTVLALCLALGLAAGPALFVGLLSLAPAAALMLLTAPRLWTAATWSSVRAGLPRAIGIGVLGALALSLAAGFLPRGATSLAEGVRVWLLGWIGPGEMHALTPVAILLVYEPLVLVFGVVGAIAAVRERDSVNVGAVWWAALAFLTAVVYSGRSGAVVAWSTIPLAVLAGQSLAREAERFRGLPTPWHAVGVAALVILLFVYTGVQLSAYASGVGPGLSPLIPEARLAVAGGALIVAALAVVLIGLGWSWDVARSGTAAAGAVLLLLVTLSSGWRLNYFRLRPGASELWNVSAPTYGIHRLAATVASLSVATRGVGDELPLAIDDASPPPSLLWALRDYPRFTSTDTSLAESPPVLLSRKTNVEPRLGADYLGQTIVLRETKGFAGPLPPAFLQWWWRREVPVVEDPWLLLVRADVATLGESAADSQAP